MRPAAAWVPRQRWRRTGRPAGARAGAHDGTDLGAHGRGEGAFVAGGVVRGYREVIRGVRLQSADGECRRVRIGKLGNADVPEEIVRRPIRVGFEIDAVALEIDVPVGVPGQRDLLGMAPGAEEDQTDQKQDRRQPRSEEAGKTLLSEQPGLPGTDRVYQYFSCYCKLSQPALLVRHDDRMQLVPGPRRPDFLGLLV